MLRALKLVEVALRIRRGLYIGSFEGIANAWEATPAERSLALVVVTARFRDSGLWSLPKP